MVGCCGIGCVSWLIGMGRATFVYFLQRQLIVDMGSRTSSGARGVQEAGGAPT